MPLLGDRVQETTSTQGTGSVTLLGAVEGYRTFNSVFANGDVVFYTIDDTFGNWEVGYGAVSTGVLSRTTVLDSSNSNNLVNFPVGTKRVFCVAPKPALLPNQTGSSGKFLTTDGTNPSWTTVASGGVNSVAIATNYGFKGTSSGSSSVTLSLQTNVTGILKGNASTGTVTAAAAGTDYAAPTAGTVSQLLANDGSGGFSNVTVSTGLSYNSTTKVLTNASTATVSSVTFTGDGTVLSSTPSTAVTTSGTLTAALNTQTANRVLAGPVGGGAAAPTFRSLVAADIPSLPYAGTTTGQTILAGNNIGGFQNVTLSGLSYNTGTSTLSVTGSGSLVINAADYGASPSASGTTNTTAINNAIAAAKSSPGANTVFIPAGTYNVTGTINISGNPANRNNWGIQLVGAGNWATRLIQQSTTAVTVLFDAIGGAGLSGIYLGQSGTATDGAAIKIINQSGYIDLTSFTIENTYVGVLVYGTSPDPSTVLTNVAINLDNFRVLGCIQNSVAVYNSADVFMSNFILSAAANEPSVAQLGHIRLYDQAQAITMVNGDVIGGRYSMTTEAAAYTSSHIPERNNITNMYFDSSVYGVVLNKSQEFDFVNCWFATVSSAAGVTLQYTQSMRFTNCKFYNNGFAGIQTTVNSKYVTLTACDFQSNSKASSGGYAGCQFDGGAQNFQVLGCVGNNELFGGLQAAALYIGPSSDKFIVSNNNFNGTSGGGIINSAGTSSTKIVSQNLG
jgi:hypothetical protein